MGSGGESGASAGASARESDLRIRELERLGDRAADVARSAPGLGRAGAGLVRRWRRAVTGIYRIRPDRLDGIRRVGLRRRQRLRQQRAQGRALVVRESTQEGERKA